MALTRHGALPIQPPCKGLCSGHSCCLQRRPPLTPCCWLLLRLQVSIIISLPTPLLPESVSNSESYSQTPILGLDICLGASHRSASLVVVQPGDQRNSLETATETPRLLDGDILQRVLERQLNTTSEQDTATAFATQGRRLPFTGRIDVSCQGLIKPYN